jgi:hypothetical protein
MSARWAAGPVTSDPFVHGVSRFLGWEINQGFVSAALGSAVIQCDGSRPRGIFDRRVGGYRFRDGRVRRSLTSFKAPGS